MNELHVEDMCFLKLRLLADADGFVDSVKHGKLSTILFIQVRTK